MSRARCSRELVEHLIGHNLDIAELIDDGVIHHRMDESLWPSMAKFMVGDRVIMEAPRDVMAWMLRLDSVRPRGQAEHASASDGKQSAGHVWPVGRRPAGPALRRARPRVDGAKAHALRRCRGEMEATAGSSFARTDGRS